MTPGKTAFGVRVRATLPAHAARASTLSASGLSMRLARRFGGTPIGEEGA